MRNYLIMSFVSFLIAGCGTYPWEHDYWKLNNQSVPYPKLKSDMLSCGFANTANNTSISDNTYIKNAKCMEKKGYLFNGKRTCDKSVYKDLPACK
ncbi:hypothetical protein LVJ83_09845 [Uruburuella testudinis]|uniref:Lipoprotein n=1 Tax=Uruburuella testudinis TaxID=1282863 RepID=A0ABY4DQC9_9NEIS|nr:hypothetical protein [Uruburuella testudinis]UOO81260.1 hypothetical protein LVJ83_09845 [Uruburuella testudinis]